ncbi:L-histidine N(alpha)-methyltransferase [Sulfuritalea hydrogenivorans]|uniref:Putative methyltransferase n=1 Tax=Sulfuritalea hydrogenivorans sk43H TaxID=1223802 RepID=W0SJ35_9PROT|nr:L-histidine N(alpha)-methyltransferase [Sulfuritalea hydrogenivorans]BAO29998.1 putative methyltransferase [Sulfuritalea hydrogenivorans sk43H]
MPSRIRLHQILDWDSPQQNTSLRRELAAGLLQQQAAIAPKFFYDKLGSRLFEAITELPEYYPTRTEAAIFDKHLADIRKALGEDFTLIDLGCGSCGKAGRLFHAGLLPSRYVAVDISVEFMRDSLQQLKRELPAIEMTGVGLDFTAELQLPDDIPLERRTFFYPGSSIGNFSPPDAERFLRGLADRMDASGGLLIGVDLVKDKAVLDAAYDDPLGVTAAFNRNLLRHVNARLGADFDIGDWRHVAFYNIANARIEMYLEARRALTVSWPEAAIRHFAAGERIHTENSYKYSPEGFTALLDSAGFGDIQPWTDPHNWFALFFARPVK